MSESKTTDPPARRVLDGLLISGLLLLCLVLGCFRQYDTDIWWHLRTGQMILERREVPRKDWFTFTSSDRDWIDLHWLFQVSAAQLYKLGGMRLLTLASATLGTLAVAAALAGRQAGWSVPVAVVCWLPAVFLLSGRLYVRPEVLTLVLLAIYLTVLFHADRRPRLLWILVPLQILWVNVQGLFVFGPVLLGFYWVDGLFRQWLWPGSVALAQRFTVAGAVMLACLGNPYDLPVVRDWFVGRFSLPRGMLFPIELFRKMSWDAAFYSTHIAELESVPQFIRHAGFWQVYLLLHLGLLGLASLSFGLVWSRRSFSLFRPLMFLAFAWLSLQATRNSGQFALVAGAVTAWNFCEWAAVRSGRIARASMDQSLAAASSNANPASSPPAPRPRSREGGRWYDLRTCSSPARIALAGVLGFCVWSVISGRFYALAGEGRLFGLEERPLWHAHEAARFAARSGMPDRVIAFHLGHAAVFEFHKRDEQRVFCDPRLEVVSREVQEQYHRIEEAIAGSHVGWDRLLAQYNLRTILADHREHVAAQAQATLLGDPNWRCVYFDPVAAVYLDKETAAHLGLEPVDFAARFLVAASRLVAPTRDRPPRRLRLSSEPHPAVVEAEALIRIARGVQERRGGDSSLVRSLLLLASARARDAVRQQPTAHEAWRSLGIAHHHLAIQASVTNSRPSGLAAWDPVATYDAARARYALTRASEFGPNDFVTLGYLFDVARLEGDRAGQQRIGQTLRARGGRTARQEKLLDALDQTLEARRSEHTESKTERPTHTATHLHELRDQVERQLAAGDLDEAVQQFASFIGAHGKLPWSLADRYAGLLLLAGQPDAAREVWQNRIAGEYEEAHRSERLAHSLLIEGDYSAAAEAYGAALRLSPDLSEAHWGLARCHLEMGDVSGLIAECAWGLRNAKVGSDAYQEFEWMAEFRQSKPRDE